LPLPVAATSIYFFLACINTTLKMCMGELAESSREMVFDVEIISWQPFWHRGKERI
jgi:hypothetical protein